MSEEYVSNLFRSCVGFTQRLSERYTLQALVLSIIFILFPFVSTFPNSWVRP